MRFSELEADLLKSKLVIILSFQKPPFSKEDKEALLKGVELLGEIKRDIVSPRTQRWVAQYLGVSTFTGPRGRHAMTFFGLGELDCEDKLKVMGMTLNHLASFGGISTEDHLELHNFFLSPQVSVP